jgi:hypothetical protein
MLLFPQPSVNTKSWFAIIDQSSPANTFNFHIKDPDGLDVQVGDKSLEPGNTVLLPDSELIGQNRWSMARLWHSEWGDPIKVVIKSTEVMLQKD